MLGAELSCGGEERSWLKDLCDAVEELRLSWRRSHHSTTVRKSKQGLLPSLEDLLFYTIAEGQEKIPVHKFITALKSTGLRTSDPRLKECMDMLRLSLQTSSDGVMLDKELFKKCVQSNIVLLTQAFRRKFVIPDFMSFTSHIDELFESAKKLSGGKVADYIPQLSKFSPDLWGVSLCTVDGQRHSVGDTKVPFCLQSCVKPLKYAISVNDLSTEYVHRYVGKEPSGLRFNKLFLNEDEKPHNPMVNAGAIVVTSLIKERSIMSAVWKYFTISEKDIKFAICNICSAEISKGGAVARHFSTTGLIYHLKARHPNQHAEYSQATKLKTPTSTTPSIATAFERVKKFANDSAKAQDITEKLIEFIALDDQPFSVVEDIGFRRLLGHIEPRYTLPSRRYLAETCLPKMFDRIAKHIHELMSTDIPAISFTTDIWSSDVSPTSLLSLTAQWIDTDFNLKNILLHAQKFVGSHTAAAISETLETMLETWHIDKSKVHLIVRDNARNMVKAMENSGIQSIPCMAHTLQLAVNEGVLSQRSISEITATGRKIVGHFKHSILAYSRLQDVQVQFGMPPTRLQQDVATRLNSTYYMLESLIDLKRVLAAYMSDHELPVTLSSHQWMLMENIVSLLAPFEQLTKEISSSNASVAEVITLITALKRLLAKEAQTDDGVKTAKKNLIAGC
ncbi:zinc finger BED domain-containing protein 4-like isoform X2 [Hyla sarda]|uniref:zinc finger BED domain-containing protein 4-like isoform X2 n=1 Tax=Hyla sarda TaxID=327740 RepID=UPI0024C27223|nr:zinc finger BED domain-containing protein 4-like isoform X2 [Hyla sarda]